MRHCFNVAVLLAAITYLLTGTLPVVLAGYARRARGRHWQLAFTIVLLTLLAAALFREAAPLILLWEALRHALW